MVAASSAIVGEADIFRGRLVHLADRDGRRDIVHRCVLVQCVANRHDRSAMASAHAGGPDNPDAIAEPATQSVEQLCRPGELAAQAVAYPHR